MLKSKRFIKKAFIVFVLGLTLITAVPKEAFAASYSLWLPYPLAGSMRSAGPVKKTSTGTPYVNPAIATTPTNYMLSPQSKSDIKATGIIRNVTDAGRKNFSYLSGYGGQGSSLYLSAYPDRSEYDPYRVRGTWSP